MSALGSEVSTRFAPLANADFRKLLLAKFTSTAGFWLTFIALYGIFVFDQGIGALEIGAMALVTIVPKALGGPVMGLVVDRLSRRRILIFGELTTAMFTMSLVFVRSLAFAYLILFLNSLISSLTTPATKSIIPQIFSEDDDLLSKANGLLSSGDSIAQILGPSAAGALLFVGSVTHLFVIDAATSVLGATFVYTMTRYTVEGGHDHGIVSGLKEGFMLPFASATVAVGVGVGFVTFGAMGIYDAMLPLYAREILATGESDLGLIISTIAVGSLVAGAVTGAFGEKIAPLTGIAVGLFVNGLAILSLTNVGSVAVALGLSVVIGFATSLTLIYTTTYLQTGSSDRIMGRVMGMFTGIARTGQISAVFFASLIVERYGLPLTFVGVSAILLAFAGVVMVAGLRWLPAAHVSPETE